MISDLAKRSYHHGDLRSALIRAGVEILQKEGPEALSLRAVARAAGVSQTAPYRHFTDRRALVAAIAEDGFGKLQDALMQAMQSDSGRLGLKAVALAYVQFAHENGAQYRVMFGPEVAATEDLPELRSTARSVLGFVEHGIASLQQAGLVGPGNPALMAVSIWSMLHGLVMLSLDGQAGSVTDSLDQLVEESTRIMMFGMAADSSR